MHLDFNEIDFEESLIHYRLKHSGKMFSTLFWIHFLAIHFWTVCGSENGLETNERQINCKSETNKPGSKPELRQNWTKSKKYQLIVSTQDPDVEIENSGKKHGKSRIPKFCDIQVIVFDFSYLPVTAVETQQVRYHEKIVKNIF